MKLPDADTLKQSYATNHWLIGRLTEGLSNEDSLVQPPFPGNCLNWVVGHILAGRHTALKLLGAELVWRDVDRARYATGSEPITSDNQGLTLERLLSDLDVSQERIADALEAITAEQLAEDGETDRGIRPVAQHLAGLHWHETYHTGQLELLRELARKDQDAE